MTTTVAFTDLESLTGRDLGSTGYVSVTQEHVGLFAEATGDHQWIHVDPVRAKDGPFGGTIAHGYLSLALVIPFFEQLLEVRGVTTKVNYGLDRVRFVSPVPVGSRVRLSSTIREVTAVQGGYQLVADHVLEGEGAAKPAVVATTLFRFYA